MFREVGNFQPTKHFTLLPDEPFRKPNQLLLFCKHKFNIPICPYHFLETEIF